MFAAMQIEARAAGTPPAPAAADVHMCPNCGAPLAGRYCHACGQKRIEEHERRFTWFVAQFFRAVTMVDGKLLRSLGRLVFRPGVLDRDWLQGRRRTNVAPLSLFLLANLIYFFHPPLSDLNLSLGEQLGQTFYGTMAGSMVQARLDARGVSLESYALAYGQQVHAMAKLMVILHVPAMGAVLLALHYRRRIFYVDHLALGLHFWAFLLIHFMATPSLLAAIHQATGFGSRTLLQVVIGGGLLLYAWQQLRLAYQQPAWMAALKLPVLLVGITASHMLYRFVQFLLVFSLT
jgi:hypothetical protein